MMTVYIVGAGGHAQVIADSFICAGEKNLFFVDQKSDSKKRLGHYEVLSDVDFSNRIKNNPAKSQLIIGVGDNALREKIVTQKSAVLSDFVNAIHPSAVISQFAQLGSGIAIMPMASIGTNTKVGNHTIINTGALVDHDCIIEEFASLGPGCVLGGGVFIGHGSAIGIGAVIKHGIKIGKNVVIGAGANVTKDIPDDVVAYGNPCAVIRARKLGDKYL